MPKAAPSRCTQGCGAFAVSQGRCEKHQRKAWANTSARNRVLEPSQWARVAREHRTIEPACRGCGTSERLQVDHITEIADGGAPYDHSNLQTLCEDCHKEKTAAARALRKAIRGRLPD